MFFRVCVYVSALGCLSVAGPVLAQSPPPQEPHVHPTTPAADPARWSLMQDGVVYGLFNRQGGPRGGKEFVVPNWWMGMLTRAQGRGQLTLNLSLSLDPATVGTSGYREIFQAGEALDGEPLVDRQHPHDFLMQLGGTWRTTFSETTSLTVAAALAGEPTLGPVAFMHRPSAAGLPMAPLGHHTFDSTHISFGVVSASIDRRRWTVEGSLFNGREPDDERWDVDMGRMDSIAGRVWFRPTPEWSLQMSSGRLVDPEELEPGTAVRTTASASHFRAHDSGFTGVTIAYGVTAAHGERRHGAFAELTTERGANSVFGRAELQQVEADTLLTGHGHDDEPAIDAGPVGALTIGAARRVGVWKGFDAAVGAEGTVYAVPGALRASHGRRPLSFQVFVRVRLPTGGTGRMWNMVMSRGHGMAGDEHAGHVVR